MEKENVTSISEITPEDNPDNSVNEASLKQYRPLYKAVCRGDWKAANDFLKEHPEGMTSKIDGLGSTALHIAAGFGHLHIVEELVKLMSKQDLELKYHQSVVAFFEAVDTGIVEMAEFMIKKNTNLVIIPNMQSSSCHICCFHWSNKNGSLPLFNHPIGRTFT
ncbi:hypothetical protein L6164_008764 [Bauhinia variegata]|uniref:Uncharacterized protein n=1 Tax=Bauhinia variegata TaxID=167791 RepID=A0ACB9PGM1_BAUVA|nr:hypothetical protein L6164_008764 [Bauhinia variegata]